MADWWSRLQIPLEFQVQNPAECVSLASADGSGRNLYLCMTAPKILFWRCCQKDHVALKRIFSSCSCNVLTMLSGTSRKAVNRVFVLSFEKKPSHWSKKAQAAFSFLSFFFLSVSCSWLKKQKNAFCTISCRTHIPDSSVMFLLQINWQFQFQVKFFFLQLINKIKWPIHKRFRGETISLLID